jgi:CBS domain containing-hemolysin-like protein
MNWLIIGLVISALIAFNALYVAAEFSAVSTRRSRMAQLANDGNRVAKTLLFIVEDPKRLDTYVATCQVGITISSLVLGAYSRSAVAPLLSPWLKNLGNFDDVAALTISITLVLLFSTMLQVVVGELIPKNIGIQYPERLAIMTAVPMQWSITFFKPLIWLFNGSGQIIMKLFSSRIISEHAHLHDPDEIVRLVEESTQGGLIQQEERRLLKNTLEMRELAVRQVMIPRTRMMAAPNNLTLDELFRLVAQSQYSRFPLFQGSIDNIVGVVHLKDLLCIGRAAGRDINDVMRQVPFVPETMLVKTVISLLQRRHLQMAIVLDEYGGTAGMVTLEDLIEEIFGELQDEFDPDNPPLRVVGDRIWIRGDMLVSDLNQSLETELPESDVDTIGGLTLNSIGHVPSVGEEIWIDGIKIKVEQMSGRGVTSLSTASTPELLEKLQQARL